MSIARKCDVCGELYEPYNMSNAKDNPNGIMFLNIDNAQKYFSHKAMDCCPNCMSRLQEYIKYIKSRYDTNARKGTAIMDCKNTLNISRGGRMTDLNKMFPGFTNMIFNKRDVVILPIESIVYNSENGCPNELLRVDGQRLKELEESCDCETGNRAENLSCYECWQRASEIVMNHYFGEEEDGKKEN